MQLRTLPHSLASARKHVHRVWHHLLWKGVCALRFQTQWMQEPQLSSTKTLLPQLKLLLMLSTALLPEWAPEGSSRQSRPYQTVLTNQ
jgi:hypothetical protein